MKTKFTSRALSLLLVVLMCLSLLPTVSFAAGSSSVTISVTAQTDESGFAFINEALTVESDLSEKYAGYEDEFDGEQVSTVDVIIAAHIATYGESDWEDKLSTTFTKAFDKSGYMCHAVNNMWPGDEQDTLNALLHYKMLVGQAMDNAKTWANGNYVSQLYPNAQIDGRRINQKPPLQVVV